MNEEIRGYLRIEAMVAAAFNFFINGMIAALVYHKADMVPTDTLSIAIDLTLTCIFTFTVSAFFNWGSLKRTKTAGIFEPGSKLLQRLSRLFSRPLLFGILLGSATAALLFAVTAPVFAWLGLPAIPFGWYMALKTIFCALLGGGVSLIDLYVGMHIQR